LPNWRFWEKQASNANATEGTIPGRTAYIDEPVPKPIDTPAPQVSDSERARRLDQLKRRREGALYDLSQAELALQEDNPWRERVELLNETLDTVARDLDELEKWPKRELPGLPETPIEIRNVTTEEPTAVTFQIGDETFHYEADLDWAERGGPVVHGDLIPRSGNPETLIPNDFPPEIRSELADHLTDSLFVFATDLRDRAIDGEPMPATPTLAGLARPCPECGGWQDWKGNCAECKRRQWKRQQLEAEADRLQREQRAEIEDQEKWAERLPVARRRLADIDAEIASLGE